MKSDQLFPVQSVNTLNSYPVAGFQSWADIKDTVKLYVTLSQKIRHKLVAYAALIGLATGAVMWTETRQFNFLQEKLRERDERLRAAAAEFRATSKKKTN